MKITNVTSSILSLLLTFVAIGVISAPAADGSRDARLEKYLATLGSDSPYRADIKNYPVTIRPEAEQLPESARFRPTPRLRAQVDFWKNIYSRYTTRQIVIHDKTNLALVYEIIDLDKVFRGRNVSPRTERKYARKRAKHFSAILNRLYKRKGTAKTAEERRVAAVLGNVSVRSSKKYRAAARNIRSQLGQADRFRDGLRRSGRYLGAMRKIFRDAGLPEELCALPHVESSFDYNAYSSAGAAGVWQFTRGTGRLFMKINYTVDERRDPITSTRSAAKLLKQNYEALGSWPLAITAYNHGQAGMKRAKRKFGSNIATIIRNYRSRTFGFASRNFYAEFLAALDVAQHYKKHFGPISFEPPHKWDVVTLTHYMPAKTLANKLGISLDTMREYNLGLRKSVYQGHRFIPRGYKLKLPVGTGEKAKTIIASIPTSDKHSSQKHNGIHIVRRGDTLSTIARAYRVRLSALRSINNSRSDRIQIGQRLKIPSKATGKSRRKIATVQTASADGYHTVRRGDTIYEIARNYGISVKKIIKTNSLSRRAVIYPGQKIYVAQ